MDIPNIVNLPENQNMADQKRNAQLVEQKNAIISMYLTADARQRLQRVSLVSPEKVAKVESLIFQQVSTGKLAPQSVSDEQIKELLEQLSKTQEKASGMLVGGMSLLDEATGDGKIIISRHDVVANKPARESDEELSF